MAYRRRYRRRRRRRRYRRKRYRRRRRVSGASPMGISMRRMPSLFPDSALVTFHFQDYVPFELVGATAVFQAVYSMNNPASPKVDPTGLLRPMGWDQWSGFYVDFICYGSSIKVTHISGSELPYEFYLGPDGNTSPPSFQAAGTLPYYRNRTIRGTGMGISTVKNSCNVKVMEGKRIGSEDDFRGNMATGGVPNEYYWSLLNYNILDTAIITTLKVHIKYYVKLIKRRPNLPVSS